MNRNPSIFKRFTMVAASAVLLTIPLNATAYAASLSESSTTEPVLARTSSPDDSTFTYPTSTSLESASDFAVVAKDYYNNNDMEGTIATETLHVGNPTIGNASNEDYGSNILYLESVDNISELSSIRAGANMIVGDNVKITYDYNNGNGVTFTDTTTGQSVSYNDLSHFESVNNASNSSYQIDFDKLWPDFSTYAAAKAAKADTAGTTITYTDMNDPNLATAHVQCVEGENFITLPAEEVGILQISGPEDGKYSLIANIITDDSVDSYTYVKVISVDGVLGGYSSIAGRVLFNYNTYAGKIILTGNATTGVTFAPNATVVVDSASHNGSIIAATVINNNCEIHQSGFVEYLSPLVPQDIPSDGTTDGGGSSSTDSPSTDSPSTDSPSTGNTTESLKDSPHDGSSQATTNDDTVKVSSESTSTVMSTATNSPSTGDYDIRWILLLASTAFASSALIVVLALRSRKSGKSL